MTEKPPESSAHVGPEDRAAMEHWDRAEEQTAVQLQEADERARLQEELHPSRRAVHGWVVVVSLATAGCAFLMGLGQVLGILFENVGPIQYVMRLYVVLLCVLAMLVEVEWTKFARESAILRLWITRGLFYAFIGVLGLDENDTSTTRNTDRRGFNVSMHFVKVVAWAMIVCGMVYFFMGITCIQLIYKKQRTDFEERKKLAAQARDRREGYTEAANV